MFQRGGSTDGHAHVRQQDVVDVQRDADGKRVRDALVVLRGILEVPGQTGGISLVEELDGASIFVS